MESVKALGWAAVGAILGVVSTLNIMSQRSPVASPTQNQSRFQEMVAPGVTLLDYSRLQWEANGRRPCDTTCGLRAYGIRTIALDGSGRELLPGDEGYDEAWAALQLYFDSLKE